MADRHLKSKINSRPVIRWAGSKKQLLPILIKSIPPLFSRYIEPFAGSACLFLAIGPEQAILGDFNKHLIEAYRVMRETPVKLAETLHSMPNSEDYYYTIRSMNPSDMDRFSRVVRFIYLNRYCFNGVYRTNRDGRFNVPRGSRTGKIPSVDNFRFQAARLRKASLKSCDFEQCVAGAKENDFVYLDPPYVKTGRREYGEYGYGGFDETDVDRLISVIGELHTTGVHVLLSYSNNENIISRLDDHWYVNHVSARRSVAGFKHKRSVVGEILISNYPLQI